jgi:hypothetical protein
MDESVAPFFSNRCCVGGSRKGAIFSQKGEFSGVCPIEFGSRTRTRRVRTPKPIRVEP